MQAATASSGRRARRFTGVRIPFLTPVNQSTNGLVDKGIAHQDRVVPFRRGRNQRHRAFDQFLNALDILDRVGGQIGIGARAGGAFAPAGHVFVDRLARGLIGGVAGQVIIDQTDEEPSINASSTLNKMKSNENQENEGASACFKHFENNYFS